MKLPMSRHAHTFARLHITADLLQERCLGAAFVVTTAVFVRIDTEQYRHAENIHTSAQLLNPMWHASCLSAEYITVQQRVLVRRPSSDYSKDCQ